MELIDFVRAFFALIAVLSLIGLGALAAQRFGIAPQSAAAPRRKRRLALMDVLPIDQKRKAAILRCDGVDHLIVLNTNGVTVIERGINRARTEAGPASAAADGRHGPLARADERKTAPTPTDETDPTKEPSRAPSAIAWPSMLALPEPASSASAAGDTSDAGVKALWRRLRAAAPGIAARLEKLRDRRRKDAA